MKSRHKQFSIGTWILVSTLVACGGAPALVDPDDQAVASDRIFEVLADLEGDVSSQSEVNTTSDVIRIGWEPAEVGGREHQGILTFDTRAVPVDAKITGVWMYLALHPGFLSELPGSWWDYAREHMTIDLAGPLGFTGSHRISASAFFAQAHTTTSWHQDPVIGAVHLYHPDLNPSDVDRHINRSGLTQIRIGLGANPARHLVRFQSGDAAERDVESPLQAPFLYIVWE